jgi:hypothetical protein
MTFFLTKNKYSREPTIRAGIRGPVGTLSAKWQPRGRDPIASNHSASFFWHHALERNRFRLNRLAL